MTKGLRKGCGISPKSLKTFAHIRLYWDKKIYVMEILTEEESEKMYYIPTFLFAYSMNE